jgi:hypothetical protein
LVETGEQFSERKNEYEEEWGWKPVATESPKDLSSGVESSSEPTDIWFKQPARQSLNHPHTYGKPKEIEAGYEDFGLWAMKLNFFRKPGPK